MIINNINIKGREFSPKEYAKENEESLQSTIALYHRMKTYNKWENKC